MAKELIKYQKPTRVLHWIHLVAFCILFITGLIMFIPGLSMLAQDSITRVIHRVAAAVFIIAPLIYMIGNWTATWKGIGNAFCWGSDDIGWVKAAPRYYFLGDEAAMPPQDEMNTGQRLWWLITVVSGVVFVITGAIDGARSFKLSISSTLVYNQPLITRAVKVQTACFELELRITCRYSCSLLVFGYEAKGCFSC